MTTATLPARGTPAGLIWLVLDVRPCTALHHSQYPWCVEVRILDVGTDRGTYHWCIPNLADPAYVAGPGVTIPPEALS
jgi:hypothetical protein